MFSDVNHFRRNCGRQTDTNHQGEQSTTCPIFHDTSSFLRFTSQILFQGNAHLRTAEENIYKKSDTTFRLSVPDPCEKDRTTRRKPGSASTIAHDKKLDCGAVLVNVRYSFPRSIGKVAGGVKHVFAIKNSA
jgi:hypothetical protein